ncbi:MAG: neutral/alkaline non-lysosomal ceramidase N-terminal domain-containing protein, partial [Deltaproteobacteria bacterium]|nr:neutral/alkaline non-lysosomal ceramidase N-terminal domain-containing protein [Deltaproteobacteria bacterium]
VTAPLFARAAALVDRASAPGDPDQPAAPAGEAARLVFVVLDTMMITQGLWRVVLERLGQSELALRPHEVVLAATHTHSGPSGFAHHFWTNLSAPGFSPVVFAALVDGVVGAVADAFAAARPAALEVVQSPAPLADRTAFNRSWFAYNKNVGVMPVPRERRDEATDRTVTVLRARGRDGRVFGLLQWFGLHATVVHSQHRGLHPDYKGLTAMGLEADGLGVVLAQECCGDVSPNHRWDAARGYEVGSHDDDLDSAAHIAASQLRHTRALLEAPGTPLRGLSSAIRYVDMGQAISAPAMSPDGREHRTTRATLGLSMAEGTAEGPGPMRPVRALNRALSAFRARLGLDPKVPFLELGRGRDGKLGRLVPMHLTPPLDPVFTWVRDRVRGGGVHAGPWVPEQIPVQLVRLGSFAILAIPFEATTVCGRRLRATVEAALPGVERVVVTTYASAYVGYLTTFEEYQVQHYEAGYTLFGAHSLGALRTEVQALAAQLGQVPEAGVFPPPVDTAPLEKLRFVGPWTA